MNNPLTYALALIALIFVPLLLVETWGLVNYALQPIERGTATVTALNGVYGRSQIYTVDLTVDNEIHQYVAVEEDAYRCLVCEQHVSFRFQRGRYNNQIYNIEVVI